MLETFQRRLALNFIFCSAMLFNAFPALAGQGCGDYAYITTLKGQKVSIIALESNDVIRTIDFPGVTPAGIAVSPDQRRVYFGDYGGGSPSVYVIDTFDNSTVATIPTDANPAGLAVDASGEKLFVATQGNNSLAVVDTAQNIVIAKVPTGLQPVGVAIHPDQPVVYVTNQGDNSLSIIDSVHDTLVETVALPVSYPIGLAVHPDGSTLYVAAAGSNELAIVDTKTRSVVGTVPMDSPAQNVILSDDGGLLYAANTDVNLISVIDTATRQVIQTIPAGGSPFGLQFRPDVPTTLYATNVNGTEVNALDIAVPEILATIPLVSSPLSFGRFMVSLKSDFKVSSEALQFSSGKMGEVSVSQGFTLENVGSCGLQVSTVEVSGDFSQINDCPEVLSPGAVCNFKVFFNPTSGQQSEGKLFIWVNDGATSISVTLFGSVSTEGSVQGDSLMGGGCSLQKDLQPSFQNMGLGTFLAMLLPVSMAWRFSRRRRRMAC